MKKRNLFNVLCVLSPVVATALFSVNAQASLISLKDDMMKSVQTGIELRAQAREIKDAELRENDAAFMENIKRDLKDQKPEDFSITQDEMSRMIATDVSESLSKPLPLSKELQEESLRLSELIQSNKDDDTTTVDLNQDPSEEMIKTTGPYVDESLQFLTSDFDNGEEVDPEVIDAEKDKIEPEVTDAEKDKIQLEVADAKKDKIEPEVTDTEKDKIQPEVTDAEKDKIQPEVTDAEKDKIQPEVVDAEKDKIEPEVSDAEKDNRAPAEIATPVEIVDSLEESVADLTIDIEALEEEPLISAEDLTKLQGDLAILQTEKADADIKVKELSDSLETATAQSNLLQIKLDEIKDKLAKADDALQQLQKKQEKHEEIVAQKNEEISEKETEIEELKNTISQNEIDFNTTLDQGNKAYCTLLNRTNKLEAQVEEFQASSPNQMMMQMMQMMMTFMQANMANMYAGTGPTVRVHNGVDNQYKTQQNNSRMGLNMESLNNMWDQRLQTAMNPVYDLVGNLRQENDNLRNQLGQYTAMNNRGSQMQAERPFAFNFNTGVIGGDRFNQMNSQNSAQFQNRMGQSTINTQQPAGVNLNSSQAVVNS